MLQRQAIAKTGIIAWQMFLLLVTLLITYKMLHLIRTHFTIQYDNGQLNVIRAFAKWLIN